METKKLTTKTSAHGGKMKQKTKRRKRPDETIMNKTSDKNH